MDGEGVLAAGRFRLVRPIGDGGMASVWQAHDEKQDRAVAVKIIPATRDEELHARFHREARIIRKFSHKNIVEVYDAGEIADEGLLFIAMELLHGSPLSNHLHAGDPMSPEDILPVIIEACRGLEAAHAVGVIHRDMKPENIFLAIVPGQGVVPKVLDFGLSTAGDPRGEQRITIDGQILGTPMYMSPEQAISAGNLTPASDVWSMGVILYEALSGMLPFHGTTVTGVLDAIVGGDPAPMPTSVDPRTRAIVKRCLQKNPTLRYPNAAALRVDLEQALEACVRRRACIANDEVPPSDMVEGRSLTDPERIAREPPTTRPSRIQRHAFRRAGSPVMIALVAAAICAAAAFAVPRPRGSSARATSGVARVVRARIASLRR